MERHEVSRSGYDRAVTGQPKPAAVVVVNQSKPAAVTVVTKQSKWNTRMLDCCLDKKVCLCGAFCPIVLACQMAERYGECFCLPLLPMAMAMMRSGMRERYNIPGSLVDDWTVHMFCGQCALCQMARELKHQMH